MGTFRIYFFGLVCHFGDIETDKRLAVAVRAPGHRRFVKIDGTAGAELEGIAFIRFTFGGVADRHNAETDDLFADFVPNLEPLMGGRFENEAVLPHLGTVIEYPASRDGDDRERSLLSVAQLYDQFAVHIRGGKILRRGCVARLTELTVQRSANASMTITLTDRDGNTTNYGTINDGECVLIGNITPRGIGVILNLASVSRDAEDPHDEEHAHGLAAHQAGEHVRHYGAILRGENDAVLVAEDDDIECHRDTIHCSWVRTILEQLIKIGNRTSRYAECGNTAWP